jgi:hypothetical protein
LTLDKKLTREWSADNVLFLESEKPFEQFREVVRRFEIKKPKRTFHALSDLQCGFEASECGRSSGKYAAEVSGKCANVLLLS